MVATLENLLGMNLVENNRRRSSTACSEDLTVASPLGIRFAVEVKHDERDSEERINDSFCDGQ